jgi:hypothetical protein
MKDGYTQTRMYKRQGIQNHRYYHTAWIPSDIAVVGNTVRLKNDDGTWEEDWIVEDTFNTQDWKTVAERSQDYKKTRKASDI